MIKNALDVCSSEPIHTPGFIQSHGYLMIIDNTGSILYCSKNLTDLSGKNADQVLGQSVTSFNSFFGKDENDLFISQLISLAWQGRDFKPLNPYLVIINHKKYNMIISLSGDHYILDFEPEESDLFTDPHNTVGASLSQMLADRNLETILENTVIQIKNIICYDRVMIYKFHQDGHGEVVAEGKNAELETWLGLHYPASDIPEQARRLYMQNYTRLINNINEDTTPVLSKFTIPADLSNSTLRAVSPVHIQYLKNMQVVSSFSVSIIVEDELWGLIACHNYSPRFINFRQRETAKLIGQVLSSCIGLRTQEKLQKEEMKIQNAVMDITKSLNGEHISDFMSQCSALFLEAFKANGIAFLFEGEMKTIGTVPDTASLMEITELINNSQEQGIISSENIIDDYHQLKKSSLCAGFIGISLTEEIKDCLIIFRPEITKTVLWAGDPTKIVQYDEQGNPFISPRNSFEKWSEEVKGKSESWSLAEQNALIEIRDEINFAVGRKTAELRLLNEKLRDAYAELDSFAHTISHDLKIPLTTIKAFGELIIRKSSEDDVKAMSSKIVDNSNRLHLMIKTVLEYSKVGQKEVLKEVVDMTGLINDIAGQLVLNSKNSNLKLNINNTPDLEGDPILIFQVFLNIIENAVKYSHKIDIPIVSVGGSSDANEVIYTVKDNGIGMNQDQLTRIFGLFNRVGKPDEYEGSGIGLATVKKIITRHGAQIKVESEEGLGSLFTLTFPRTKTT